jgi:ketosteroid isomerase-like protein
MNPTLERFRKIYQQMAKGNMEAYYEAMADDVVYRAPSPANAPWSGIHHGKFQVRAALSHNLVESNAFQLIDVFGSGERYAWLLLFRVSADRIVEIEEFDDTAQVQAAFA